METRWLNGNVECDLQIAAKLLRDGQTVAFPTETVYGLGAHAINETAVQSIYTAKGRPSDKPLIILIHDRTQLNQLVAPCSEVTKRRAERLMDVFWPGALTLVFPLQLGVVPEAVTCGKQTIAVRMPNHPVALKLLTMADVLVAAPSANLSGNPSPTEAEHVAKDLDGRIGAIVAGGSCQVGVASTILDISGDVPVLLRQGIIAKNELEKVLGCTVYLRDEIV